MENELKGEFNENALDLNKNVYFNQPQKVSEQMKII